MCDCAIPPVERFPLVRKCRFPLPAKYSPVQGFTPSKTIGVVVGTAVFAAAVPASARAAVTSTTENETRHARNPRKKLQRSCRISYSPRFEAKALTAFWPINRGGVSVTFSAVRDIRCTPYDPDATKKRYPPFVDIEHPPFGGSCARNPF